MSQLSQKILQRALAEFQNTGKGTVWCPGITIGQEMAYTGNPIPNIGNEVIFYADYFVVYEGDADPVAEAWDEYETGTVTTTLSNGTLQIDAETGESLFYSYDLPATVNEESWLVLEARIKILSSSPEKNSGAALSICNGAYQSILWLRDEALNIDGSDEVLVFLNDVFHTVRLESYRDTCKVRVDDMLWQQGVYANDTEKKTVTFGTWATALY